MNLAAATESKTPVKCNNVLVTGGAGFIGSHLCERLLILGYNVICLDSFNNSYDPQIKKNNIRKVLQHPRFKLVVGDVLDAGLMDKLTVEYNTDVVVHLAALAGVRNSIGAPLDYVDVDIRGTVVLLEACRKLRISKFIFASSSSVYGSAAIPFREDGPLGPQASPYAVAKYSGELFCRAYNLLYGIPIVCLRFFTVYGPRQRPDMAVHIFTKAIDEGREICIYGDGNSSRDYTFIDDILDGIIASINLQCDFETINLGNSNATGILSLVKIIEKNLGRQAKLRFVSDQPGDVRATFADIRKASDLLGYNPKVGLEEGIAKFVEWYRNKS